MSLYDTARDDNENILGDPEGYTVPVILTSPPIEVNGIPANTVFGTLDPLDYDNQIRAFVSDHHTQVNLETGVPQEGLNAKATLSLKTLFDKGIIADISTPGFKNWKISWLDITDPSTQRDFLIDIPIPTRSLTHVVLLLGEIEIT